VNPKILEILAELRNEKKVSMKPSNTLSVCQEPVPEEDGRRSGSSKPEKRKPSAAPGRRPSRAEARRLRASARWPVVWRRREHGVLFALKLGVDL
jgi:hypothetical protein